MHINLEMLECVYLVSAMLMEIPYMAAHEFDARRRMISKSYYQQVQQISKMLCSKWPTLSLTFNFYRCWFFHDFLNKNQFPLNVLSSIFQLRSSERQALVGPPESMREHIVAASKAMRNGDWKKCKELIINDKMNAKVNFVLSLNLFDVKVCVLQYISTT